MNEKRNLKKKNCLLNLIKYLNLRIFNLSKTFISSDLYFANYTVSLNCKSEIAFKINSFEVDKLEAVFVNVFVLYKN